jgi:hypothetical protein
MAERMKILNDGDRREVLEPADEWSAEFLETLGAWDKPIERPARDRRQEK